MMKGLVNVIKTRFEGLYVLEDSGKNYIYNEETDDLHEASNLEMNYYKPRSKYECSWNDEYDSWKYGQNW